MHRDYGWRGAQPRKREAPEIKVRMDHVEVVRVCVGLGKHWKVKSRTDCRHRQSGQSQRARGSTDQLRGSYRVARGEQGHFMTAADQFLREVGDAALGSAIKVRGNSLIKGG